MAWIRAARARRHGAGRSTAPQSNGKAKALNRLALLNFAAAWQSIESLRNGSAQHSLEKHGFEIYGRMPKLKGVIYGEIQSWG